MSDPLRSVLVYASILCTILAGLTQLTAWAACAGASVLAVVALRRRDAAIAAGTPGVLTGSEFSHVSACVLNAAAIATAAFAFGRASGWVWGI
jgi:hypothetical protein